METLLYFFIMLFFFKECLGVLVKAVMLEMKPQSGSQIIWANQAARFISLPSQELYRRMKSGATPLNPATR